MKDQDLDRIAMLCDELHRRRVPAPLVRALADWVKAQSASATVFAEYDGHRWMAIGPNPGRAVCQFCGNLLSPFDNVPCTP